MELSVENNVSKIKYLIIFYIKGKEPEEQFRI